MVLEGAMIIIATGSLTILHPAVAFQGVWPELNFKFRTKKGHGAKGSVSDVTEQSSMTHIDLDRQSPNAYSKQQV
jgi:hypothetical protein